MALVDHVHDISQVIGVMDNKVEGLRKEVVELKAGSGLEAIATDEGFREDRLLKLTRTMEGLKFELPKEVVAEYKKSTNFEMGLMQIGHVSYKYEYQVVWPSSELGTPSSKLKILSSNHSTSVGVSRPFGRMQEAKQGSTKASLVEPTVNYAIPHSYPSYSSSDNSITK
ncbi:hypothetical protein GW17_00043280 [Ensete ventricosum]|nr:hypothetical protein GW17_00043280 [Ensete ventricosum]